MAQIFLSYAHEDEERIQSLVQILQNAGWSVFWDRRIPTGQTWRIYIGEALKTANCVVVAWSRYSIASSWVAEEADSGKKRGILVPVLLDPVEPPLGFGSIQAADLSDLQRVHSSKRIEQLLSDIGMLLNPNQPSIDKSFEPKSPSGPPRGAMKYETTILSRWGGMKVTISDVLLGFGILVMPYVFCWFLLREGYSKTARLIGFGWLLFVVGYYIILAYLQLRGR